MSGIDNATVITPFSWASPAIELGNRHWRKKILPIGDVQYQGRTLHFTEDYLSKLGKHSGPLLDVMPAGGRC